MIDSKSLSILKVYNVNYKTPYLNYENGANRYQREYYISRTNFLNK